jgi:hypothetical protein
MVDCDETGRVPVEVVTAWGRGVGGRRTPRLSCAAAEATAAGHGGEPAVAARVIGPSAGLLPNQGRRAPDTSGASPRLIGRRATVRPAGRPPTTQRPVGAARRRDRQSRLERRSYHAVGTARRERRPATGRAPPSPRPGHSPPAGSARTPRWCRSAAQAGAPCRPSGHRGDPGGTSPRLIGPRAGARRARAEVAGIRLVRARGRDRSPPRQPVGVTRRPQAPGTTSTRR